MRVVMHPEDRKQEILDGAIKVFAEKGYEKTTITDIARSMKISQGLCYRYFLSKEDMYDAALEEYAELIAGSNIEMYRKVQKGKTLKEQLKLMDGKMQLFTSSEKKDQALYSMFHSRDSRKMHDELFRKVADKVLPYVKEILEEAKQKGEISIADSEATACFIVYGQIGYLMKSEAGAQEKVTGIQQCLQEILFK
ncbi:MAG: TetR/AcrR family transcriptional regulator [Butyrivibrio sp.]|nr:TetR/AcrR family transcriptional regulator [Butyrivibrio sp.]